MQKFLNDCKVEIMESNSGLKDYMGDYSKTYVLKVSLRHVSLSMELESDDPTTVAEATLNLIKCLYTNTRVKEY